MACADCIFFFILSISPYLVRGLPYITSAKGIGERGRKMAAYADIADIVGGPKKSKYMLT